ncbi:MAG: hypothetical protein ACYCOO_04140 [Chitinophagaceae bacterium]
MKKFILLAFFFGWGMVAQPTGAQIRFSINIGDQPPWGPAGYEYARYYYFPDLEIYYDVYAHQFIYLEEGQWVFSDYLPPQYRNYDLYQGDEVVINEPRAYLYYNQDRIRYRNYRNHYYRREERRDNENYSPWEQVNRGSRVFPDRNGSPENRGDGHPGFWRNSDQHPGQRDGNDQHPGNQGQQDHGQGRGQGGDLQGQGNQGQQDHGRGRGQGGDLQGQGNQGQQDHGRGRGQGGDLQGQGNQGQQDHGQGRGQQDHQHQGNQGQQDHGQGRGQGGDLQGQGRTPGNPQQGRNHGH